MYQLRIPWSAITASVLLSGSLLTFSPASAVTFDPPGNEAPSGQTTGGATRNGGQCNAQTIDAHYQSQAIATPLLPKSYPGLTVEERPTFFAYVPKTGATEASFTLLDASGNLIYRTKVALPVEGGVTSISLPKTVSALEVDRNYKWFLEIHCLPNIDPDNPVVDGWVSRIRVNSSLARELAAAKTSHDRAIAYARAGIWYEAVSNLVEARRSAPQDLTLVQSWEELLTSVGLGDLASQPLNNL